MFNNLTEFSHKKNSKELLGFYLAFVLFGIIFAALLGGMSSLFSPEATFGAGFETGLRIGAFFAVIYSVAVSFVILIKRNLQNNFWYILLAILSGMLALLGGVILGMLVPVFLLTRNK